MSIVIKEIARKTKQVRPGESDFMLADGILLVPRAMVVVSKSCPNSHLGLINKAVLNGWVEAVAYKSALGEGKE